jgi:replicative DNA helicase
LKEYLVELAKFLILKGINELDIYMAMFHIADSKGYETPGLITLDDCIKDIIQTAKDALVANNDIEQEYNHDSSLEQYTAYLADGMTRQNLKGYQSHLGLIDKTINGWQKGLSYVIGGLKKTGKSRFAINLMSVLLNQNIGGIIFSLEMSENQIHNCIVGSRLGIDTAKMGTDRLIHSDFDKIVTHMNIYKDQKLYISRKSAISPDYIRLIIRSRKSKQPVDFVIVDYIQRMRAKAESRTKEVEKCALDLADIARDENVIMIVLSQLSGAAETNRGKAPIYAFFKESQAIIEAADCVIGLDDQNRGKEFVPDEKLEKELIAVILQREGISDVWLKLKAQLQYPRFECEEAKL